MASEPITFGPPGAKWRYDRNERIYDLTRGRQGPSPLTINTISPDPPPDNGSRPCIKIAPAGTALVVVDMQNFFLHPSCRDHPAGLAAVKPTVDLIVSCRAAGIQIIWLNWGLTDSDLATMPAAVLRGFARSSLEGSKPSSGLGVDLGDGKGSCLVAGSWNARIYEQLALAVFTDLEDCSGYDDVFLAKNRMSGLWDSSQPLHKFLMGGKEGSGPAITTLLFAGVNTDQCVLGTLVDAYCRGWDCVMVEDCCATTTEGASEVCRQNISRNYGFVTNSAAIIDSTNAHLGRSESPS